MKIFTLKCITFTAILLVSLSGFSQPAIEWQKSLGGSGPDAGKSIQQTTDGGYIVAGISLSADGNVGGNYGGDDYWVAKLSETGIIYWEKNLGGSDVDYCWDVRQTPDGGYILGGNSASTDGDVTGNIGIHDYWIVKLSETGEIEWQKNLGGTSNDYLYSLELTSDGGYIIAGATASSDGDVTGHQGEWDYWIVKLSASGEMDWQKSLGGSLEDFAYAVQQTSDGGYIVAGVSNSTDGDVTGNHGEYDYWLVKLSVNGEMEWQKCLGGSGGDAARSVQQTSDGGYIIAGGSSSTDGDVTGNHGGIYDHWIVKLSAGGEMDWQKCLGGSNMDDAVSIAQTQEGGYIVAGFSESTDGDLTGNYGGWDYWIVKLTETGGIDWQKNMGGSSFDGASEIQQTSDGGYIIAGWSASTDGDITGNHGATDFWIVKLSPLVGVHENEPDNTGLALYPNPTTDLINMEYLSETTETVQINIINMDGQLVDSQLWQVDAGVNHFSYKNELTKGIYLIELRSANTCIRNKVIIN